MRAVNVVSLAVCLLLLPPTAAPVSADPPIGLTQMRPAKGPFVKTDRGYMVPYKLTIPGTKTTFEMVPVPPGMFRIGSPADEAGRKADEGPQVDVAVEPFWIGKYEVTWGEYDHYYGLHSVFRKFEDAGIRKVTPENNADAVTIPSLIYEEASRYPDVGKDELTKHPAVSMTQFGARQYTKWLSKLTGELYRLPSEAEWEYACRAGTTTVYHFGDDPKKLGKYAWYFGNSVREGTNPVGGKKPNPWGIHDMHGNAAEWVLDQHGKTGYASLKKTVDDGGGIVWPTTVFPGVVRGGSWDADADKCRSAVRWASSDEWVNQDPNLPTSPWWLCNPELQIQIGFRIIRPLTTPKPADKRRPWDNNIEKLREDVDVKIETEGRGRRGLVDPKLPDEIERLKERER